MFLRRIRTLTSQRALCSGPLLSRSPWWWLQGGAGPQWGAGQGVELLHGGLGAVGDGCQWDLGVQVQKGREGQAGRVDVLQLVDDVTDGLLDAVKLLQLLTAGGQVGCWCHGFRGRGLEGTNKKQSKNTHCSEAKRTRSVFIQQNGLMAVSKTSKGNAILTSELQNTCSTVQKRGELPFFNRGFYGVPPGLSYSWEIFFYCYMVWIILLFSS